MDLANAPLPSSHERERLAALAELCILDTPDEHEFDRLARLTAEALGVAMAAVSLVDEHRQWFKARHGFSIHEMPVEMAFCRHAVATCQLLIVPDAIQDPRFSSNPLVTHEMGVRFYAGVPLIVGSGHCVGTLCIFDPAPRGGLTERQQAMLCDLAQLTTDLLEAHRSRRLGEFAAKVIDTTSDAVVAANNDGTVVYWNPAAERMFGRSRNNAVGSKFESIVAARFADECRRLFDQAMASKPAGRSGSIVDLVGSRGDGTEFPVELSLARWGDGPYAGVAAIVRDTSVRKTLERDRQQTERFLTTVVTNLPAMLFVKDAETKQYLMINRAGEEFIGRPAAEIVGATDRELFSQYGDSYEQRDNNAIASEAPYVFESKFVRDDGTAVHLRTTRAMVDGPERPKQYILGISENVTAARIAEAKVMRLAHYDSLTGLFNRASYTDRLHRLVQDGTPFAMLSIDLDRFKAVNDQFGHPAGDAVLVQVGDRLRFVTGTSGWVARVGGDEFVMVISGTQLRTRAKELAERIIAQIAEPFLIGRAVAYVGASVGIVMMPDDASSTSQLRENADLALYRAKQQGKGSACFFDAEMDAVVQDRRRLEKDLRRAVAEKQIGLSYQPVFLVKSGRITSVEALARWAHPSRGPIPPDVFISLAEEAGLIDELGEQLLRRACTDAQAWPGNVRVAVNLSPLQFLSGRLPQIIPDALRESGLSPDRLQLEVTESLVIRDVERTFEQLEELRSLGIQILMDDFGVGYSSLSYFQRFPFDKVKIDKSFIDTIATSRTAHAIVEAVIGLGEALGMGVVGEGVETQQQMDVLVSAGCTHLQGYYFSRPLAADALHALLHANELDSVTLSNAA